MKTKLIPLFATILFASPVYAETPHMDMQHSAPAASGMNAAAMSSGVVRKIDVANGNITLKHGPIVNIDMPPMTMVFRAQPPALLKKIKVGDKVKFHAESIKGALVVTAIEVVR